MRFLLAGLATWRVTHLVAHEDGPADLVVRLRARLGSSRLGELADCFQCLSVWLAMPFTPFVTRRRGAAVVSWLALSGLACLLERVVAEPEPVQVPLDVTEGEPRWDAAARSARP